MKIIKATNVNDAWLDGLIYLSGTPKREACPLIYEITPVDGTELSGYDTDSRRELDRVLTENGKFEVWTVANTIFPTTIWQQSSCRAELFQRYNELWPQLKAYPQNKKGTYFRRMITGGPPSQPNQLEFILEAFARKGARRNLLQVSIFDPQKDHSKSARLGFPCLQHLSVAPTKAGIKLNAFYSQQYFLSKGFGNLVGLSMLGKFFETELKMRLASINLYAGISTLELKKGFYKNLLQMANAREQN